MDLKSAFEFYDSVVKLKWDSDEKLAVGTDHIDWVMKAAREAVNDQELLKECIDHLEWCNYGDSYESECAEKLKKKIEAYQNGSR